MAGGKEFLKRLGLPWWPTEADTTPPKIAADERTDSANATERTEPKPGEIFVGPDGKPRRRMIMHLGSDPSKSAETPKLADPTDPAEILESPEPSYLQDTQGDVFVPGDGGQDAASIVARQQGGLPPIEQSLKGAAHANPQEIEREVRRDFHEGPSAVAVRIRDAGECTSALLVTLDQLRLNTPEADIMRGMLQQQATALEGVLALIEEGEQGKAERTYQQLVDDILKGLLRFLADEGVLKGIAAFAILSLLGVSGAYAALAGSLITASILGLDKKQLGKIIEKYRTRKDC